MADNDFWNSIVSAHRVDDNNGDRPILTPDPLESEPESDEEDRLDGVFSPQFVKTTGVHTYMRKCQEFNVVPVQQFISMMDRDVVSLDDGVLPGDSSGREGPLVAAAVEGDDFSRIRRHCRQGDDGRRSPPSQEQPDPRYLH